MADFQDEPASNAGRREGRGPARCPAAGRATSVPASLAPAYRMPIAGRAALQAFLGAAAAFVARPEQQQDHADRDQDQPRADQLISACSAAIGDRRAHHHRRLLPAASSRRSASPPRRAAAAPRAGRWPRWPARCQRRHERGHQRRPVRRPAAQVGRWRSSSTPTSRASAANGSVYASGSATSATRMSSHQAAISRPTAAQNRMRRSIGRAARAGTRRPRAPRPRRPAARPMCRGESKARRQRDERGRVAAPLHGGRLRYGLRAGAAGAARRPKISSAAPTASTPNAAQAGGQPGHQRRR